jgi:hypothetical protein
VSADEHSERLQELVSNRMDTLALLKRRVLASQQASGQQRQQQQQQGRPVHWI